MMIDYIRDWLSVHLLSVIWGVTILICVSAFVGAMVAASRDIDQFMTECQHDHKRYECEAMYKGAHPEPLVVPVVAPIVVSQ